MKTVNKVLCVVLLALAIISVVQGCRNAAAYSQDFQWDAAKVLTLKMNPYDESMSPSEKLISLGYEEYYKQMEANQFPSLLFLLFPYTLLAPLAARYAWIISNLIFTLIIILLLRKTFFKELEGDNFVVLSLLMLAGTPWRNQVGVGQHTLFAFMWFLLAVYLTDRDKPVLSGLSLAVSYFKYTLTAPLALYFVYKRKWKELFISVIPHIILTVFSAVWLEDSLINMIIKPLKVASVLTSEGSMDIGAILGGGSFTMIITVIAMLALLVVVFLLPGENDKLVISLLVLYSLIITYHRSYDFFVLVLPFSFMLDRENGDGSKRMVTSYVILVVLVFFGLRLFHESQLSILGVAAVYYVFTLFLTAYAIKIILKGKKNEKKQSD